jgi:CheY-like chemotaxis protein
MSNDASTTSILLVEDDQMDIMNVQRELRKHDITAPLHIARNGREALNLLRGGDGQPRIGKPTIVLLDINMPRMNGLELLDSFDNFGEGGTTVDGFSLFLDLLKLKE